MRMFWAVIAFALVLDVIAIALRHPLPAAIGLGLSLAATVMLIGGAA